MKLNPKYKINTELLYGYIVRHNLSKTQFAKKCKISTYNLRKILNGSFDIDIALIFKIKLATGIRLDDIFCINQQS